MQDELAVADTFRFDAAAALSWIRKALTKGHNKLPPFVLQRVSNESIQKAAVLGINLHQHALALDYDSVRHCYIKHGNALVEAKRGQRAIVAADFLRIGDILEQGVFAIGVPPKGKDGTPRLTAKLCTVDNETMIAVFSVRKKLIVLHTLWIHCADASLLN